jgi:SAM-dependent methyltransferase
MNPGILGTIDRIEADHWWYRGLRDAVARTLRHPALALPRRPRVLDAGCGAGGALALFERLLAPSYLGGFDASDEAVRLARAKVPAADVYPGDIREPELRVDRLDLVVSFDVLCIPGVAASRRGLERLVGRLAPGGLLILNLPAFEWLRSEHDVAVHASERYTARQVGSLLGGLGLAVERLSYRLFFLFPAVVASRLPGKLRRGLPVEQTRSALDRASGVRFNRAMLATLEAENAAIARGARLPWGSSVYAVGRKPA